jgi:hypothetical protein
VPVDFGLAAQEFHVAAFLHKFWGWRPTKLNTIEACCKKIAMRSEMGNFLIPLILLTSQTTAGLAVHGWHSSLVLPKKMPFDGAKPSLPLFL